MELEMEHMKFPFKNSSGRYENKYYFFFPSKIEAKNRKIKFWINFDDYDIDIYDNDDWDNGGDHIGR